MKSLILASLCAVSVGAAGAQALRVNVRSDREALPYAYIYVNGRAAAVTDSMGVAILPDRKVRAGDTLSASFVGTTPDYAIADGTMLRRGTCDLLLSEMYTLTAEEVKVKADVEKLFRKTVRLCKPFYYQAHLKANFLSEIRLPNGDIYPVTGRFTARNSIPDYLWFTQIKTRSDTSNHTVARVLRADMLEALCAAKTALAVLAEPTYQKEAVYGYMGWQGEYRVFRISYPNVQPGLIYQVMIWVDRNRIIRRYETNRIEPGCTTRVKAEGVRVSKYSMTLPDQMLMPDRIHVENIYANGARTVFDIWDWHMILKLTSREVQFKE